MERRKRRAGLLAVALLAVSGMASQRLAPQACTFVAEFERVGRSAKQVSFQERVLYSLIEAKDQSCKGRAPG